MPKFAVLPLLLVCFWLADASGLLAQDDWPNWIPSSANTVAVIKSKELLKSPLGQREGWANRHREAYLAGEVATPPGVELLVRATQYRLGAEDATVYTLFRTFQERAVQAMARRDHVLMERIQDRPVMRARGRFFAQLTPHLACAVEPADRQVLARWLKEGLAATGPTMSAWLKSAVVDAADGAQVIMAIDLEEMFDAAMLEQWLRTNPGGRNFANPRKAAELFATIRGARLSFHVDDKIAGRLALTFNEDVGGRDDMVLQVLEAWLDESGSRIDAPADVSTRTEKNLVTIERPFGVEALQKVMSLIRAPHPAPADEAQPAQPAAKKQEPDPAASSQYFQSVNKLVDSLNRQNKKANDYLKTATWHESSARKIADLPTDGVDPELVAWGNGVAQQLEGLAQSLRGVPIEVNALEKTISYNVSVQRYRYASTPFADLYRNGSTELNTNLPEVRLKQAQVIEENASQRDAVWSLIMEQRAQMNRQMREKYGGKFKPR